MDKMQFAAYIEEAPFLKSVLVGPEGQQLTHTVVYNIYYGRADERFYYWIPKQFRQDTEKGATHMYNSVYFVFKNGTVRPNAVQAEIENRPVEISYAAFHQNGETIIDALFAEMDTLEELEYIVWVHCESTRTGTVWDHTASISIVKPPKGYGNDWKTPIEDKWESSRITVRKLMDV